MAWNFGDGFDLYAAPADAINGYWDTAGATAIAFAAGRFSGSQCVQISSTSQALTKSSGVNDAVHHVVVAFRQTTGLAGTTVGSGIVFTDGTTAQCSIVFRSDGAILLTSGNVIGTTLATYAGAVAVANTWYAFEFEVIINNTTGRFRVRKNGNPADDFDSGAVLNTRVSANNYANKLQFGFFQSGGTNHQYDDLFWRSDASSVAWMGDIRCYTRMPASDQSVQFSRTPTGVLTQTVPSTATSNTGIANNTAKLTAVTAAYSGTVTGVSVAVFTGNSGSAKCAIYADNGSGVQPSAVLATATAAVTPVPTGTMAFTFSPGLAVVKGTTYWLAVMADTSTGSWTDFTSSLSIGCNAAASYSTFPQANPVVTNPAFTVQFSMTYSATPANWQAVAEAQQDGTTSYVSDSTVGHADFYGVGPIGSTPSSVIAVTTRGYVQKSDAGSRTVAVQIKSGSTTVASPTLVLGASAFQWAWRTDIVDPNTSSAWTAAAVDAAQIGPIVVS
jgi:hypothetical protein